MLQIHLLIKCVERERRGGAQEGEGKAIASRFPIYAISD